MGDRNDAVREAAIKASEGTQPEPS